MRANQENERLQGQANDIAADAVAATREATAASTRLGELQLQYTKNLTEATNRQAEAIEQSNKANQEAIVVYDVRSRCENGKT